MLRLLFLALLIWLGVTVLRLLRRLDARGRGTPGAPGQPVKTVPCAHCGVYLPSNEALGEGERRYCSEAHRAAGDRQAPR
ncbi:MAG: PP0621 family protein [Gammaproteobacteria bacterium]